MRKLVSFLTLVLLGLVSTARADSIQKLNLLTNDMVYDSIGKKIYATVPQEAPAHPNSIAIIDPVTASMIGTIPLKSSPSRLVISDNGQFLYVAVNEERRLLQIDTASRTLSKSFDLNPGDPAVYALDFEPVPGQSHSIALVRASRASSPRIVDVRIYDDFVPRPLGTSQPDSITFGADATRLYGYTNSITSFEYVKYKVDANGLTGVETLHPDGLYNTEIYYSGGRIYTTNGRILDAETLKEYGQFASNCNAVDQGLKKFFVLTQAGGGTTITAQNVQTLALVGKTYLMGIPGVVSRLTRYGSDGFAFRTEEPSIYFVHSHVAQSFKLIATVKRANGIPLPNVTVSADGPDHVSASTNADGVVTFPALLRGTYTVTASNPDFTFNPSSVTVNRPETGEGKDANVSFVATRSAYDINGIFRGSNSGPISNQKVEVRRTDNTLVASTATASDGTYNFSGLAAGQYYVVPPMQPGYIYNPGGVTVQLPTSGKNSPDARVDFTRTVDSVTSYRVAYESHRDSQDYIYLLRPTASGTQVLTPASSRNRSPHFNARGTKIYFDSNRTGNSEIYVMKPDGSEATNLTDNPAGDEYPCPSLDDKSVVWSSSRNSSDALNAELWYSDADGSNPRRVTTSPFGDYHASWNPTAKRIVYYTFLDAGGHPDIFTISPDGTNRVQLTTTHSDQDPNWSPVTGKIVFSSIRDSKSNREIWVMNADGSYPVRLTYNPADDGQPCWSPDGKYIYFRSNRNGNYDIFRMKPDGTDVVQITNDLADESWPTVGFETPTTFHLVGQVRNGNGAPIANQQIELRDHTGTLVSTTSTAADGSYGFLSLEASTYHVQPAVTGSYSFAPNHADVSFPATGDDAPDARVDFVRTVLSPSPFDVVFSSTRDGNEEIYILPAGQTVPIRLTNNPARDRFPSLSQDGKKIVFSSNRFGNATNDDIFVMNRDGSGLTRITSSPADEIFPQWSPDGTKILYSDNRNKLDYDIYVMNADGTNSHLVASNPDRDMRPAWSPDGTQIVFYGSLNTVPDTNIYIAPSSGTGPLKAITKSNRDFDPQWSPNGHFIIFSSTRDGHSQIYGIDTNGNYEANLSNNEFDEGTPTWSPDSLQIYFRSNRDGNYELYRMDPDGRNLTRLTNNAAEDSYPSVEPSASSSARQNLKPAGATPSGHAS